MTRKHYRAIAKALGESNASRETVNAVAWELAGFNPRFDRNIFIGYVDDHRPSVLESN